MYRFEIVNPELLVRIFKEDLLIDESGPWSSLSEAETWASLYTNKLNSGIPDPIIE